ncbi:HAD family hydrolase [Williamsia deligens]|uniref:HAD family hydrolase n=1 Tax=Williamsia deligens TaxID=321325 RepID=A0ABW3GAG6_9NOCA|nr:HAD-IA family hydrolase [Williamsia deligens]MCP2195947.1 haloacid dehalogenase superfamily, subfamily IA, variant 3 with third motif having DD or ED [Williamsia deligens]
MSAILFGSISTLVDTSETQRRAFNEAFRAHDLDWQWSREDYRAMLDSNGGADRIAEYAQQRGDTVDAAAVHQTKSEIFRTLLQQGDATARPGVLETITTARERGIKVGLVTTTSSENVAAIISALGPDVTASSFDVITDVTSVDSPKPDKAVYIHALDQLGEQAGDVVAIEDNKGGVTAAAAASIRCIAFPNENTAGTTFAEALEQVDSLDPAHVGDLAAAA